jgi:DnaD/phage-associated family protein
MARDDGQRFTGFPASGLATTIPSLFFARVLPLIQRPEELIVSVYFFFAATVGRRRRWPRFVTARELAADATLLHALAGMCGGGDHEALQRGLDLAVERGTLLRAEAAVERRSEELFVVNTPANRRRLAELTGGVLRIDEPLPPAEGSAAPNIFALYEENVGGITPLVAEQLLEAEERYSPAWIEAAFREAASLNKRNWRYVERILRRWEVEGPDYEEPERDPQSEWFERRYIEGKRHLRGRRGSRPAL